MNNIETIFNKRVQYYYASVNPLYDDTKHNEKVNKEDSCRLKPGIEYAFYKGVNYEERNLYKGLYSYVPCKTYNVNKKKDFIFKQPAINLDFINGAQTQGVNFCGGRDFRIEEIIEYWKEITNQVEAHGLLKGINFKTPELRNNQATHNI